MDHPQAGLGHSFPHTPKVKERPKGNAKKSPKLGCAGNLAVGASLIRAWLRPWRSKSLEACLFSLVQIVHKSTKKDFCSWKCTDPCRKTGVLLQWWPFWRFYVWWEVQVSHKGELGSLHFPPEHCNLFSGGFQLYFGVEKAGIVSNGDAKWRSLKEPCKMKRGLAARFPGHLRAVDLVHRGGQERQVLKSGQKRRASWSFAFLFLLSLPKKHHPKKEGPTVEV